MATLIPFVSHPAVIEMTAWHVARTKQKPPALRTEDIRGQTLILRVDR